MEVRELRSDHDIVAAFPLMATLRDRIKHDTFLAEVRRQQCEGYRLLGGFEGDRLLVLAGVRRSHTLSRGEHLFIDDLVTAESLRGRGFGRVMMRLLAKQAAAEGISRLYLDSRSSARGFYERLGFTFLSSIPCWTEVVPLARE